MKVFHTGFTLDNRQKILYKNQKMNSCSDSVNISLERDGVWVQNSLDNDYTFLNNQKNISFKGGLFSLFCFSKREDVLSGLEVEKILNKNKIRKNRKIYKLIKVDKGYSKEKLEMLCELHRRTNNIEQTLEYTALCSDVNGVSLSMQSDFLEFWDKNAGIDFIKSVFDISTARKTKSYNQQISKVAIDSYKEFGDSCLGLLSCSMKGNKFYPQVFNTYTQLTKDYNIVEPEYFNYFHQIMAWDNEKQQIGLDVIKKLFEMEIKPSFIHSIWQTFSSSLRVPSNEFLQSLTKNIPKYDDTTLISDFIYYRSKSTNDTTKSNSTILLNKKAFDLFNKLVEKIPYSDITEIDLYNVSCIVKTIKNNFKMYGKIALNSTEFLNYSDIKQLLQDLNSINMSPKRAYMIYEKLNDNDKASFDKTVSFINSNFDTETGQKVLLYSSKNYDKFKDKQGLYEFVRILRQCINDDGIFIPQKIDYIFHNIDRKSLLAEMLLKKYSYGLTDKMLEKSKILLENGISIDELVDSIEKRSGIFNKNKSEEELDIYINNLLKLKAEGINIDFINKIFIEDLSSEEVDKLIEVRKLALQKKYVLQGNEENLSDEDIEKVLFFEPRNTLSAIKTLGMSSFEYAFNEKLVRLQEIICLIGAEPECQEYEQLLEMINPQSSKKYQQLVSDIRKLKNSFSLITDDQEKKDLIKKINTLTKEKSNLVNNSIKDPQRKLEVATIFFSVLYGFIDYEEDNTIIISSEYGQQNIKNLNKILPYMNYKTKEEEQLYREALNNYILFYCIDPDIMLRSTERINFVKSKYLPKLFCENEEFMSGLVELYEILDEDLQKTNLQIFNNLKQNVKTKKIFNEYNLNYDKWVQVNPDSFIKIKVNLDNSQYKYIAIKSFEKEINSDDFKKLPYNIKDNFMEIIKSSGYDLKEVTLPICDDTGLFWGNKKCLKLYKNDKPIEFNDLIKIINTVDDKFFTNKFWLNKDSDLDIEFIKNNFKNNIENIKKFEIKKGIESKTIKETDIIVQKADINDVGHSLFLGNDAACCTAIGSASNSWSAIPYILNKFIACIEVKDGDKYVGNTMIYVIAIDDKPALMIDNIELKKDYQYNDTIRDAIFDYARMIAKEIGAPDMPIYASANRHKVNMDNVEYRKETFNILGYTDEFDVYLDFKSQGDTVNPYDRYKDITLLKIS